MKLLMITRKVDYQDASSAGFTYTWVKKISNKLGKLYVITWQKSDRGNLPENIEIESLPNNKLAKLIFLRIKLLKILPRVDGVFCHQNPEYTILSACLAKIFRKRVVSWYTHKAVNWKLHLVNLLADKILTASPESCRLKNRKKIKVVGHGIDIEKFKSQKGQTTLSLPKVKITNQKSKFTILSIGRISPVKDYQTLIEAVDIVINQQKDLEVQIIGKAGLKQQDEYFAKLKQIVKKRNLENYIKFLGPIPHNQILSAYQNSDLFINLSQTGSVDKAVLEAMACEMLVLTSNEAFEDILRDERLLFQPKNPQDLANKIIALMRLPKEEKEKIGQRLRDKVVKNHNLDKLVDKIIKEFL